jgi:glycosyltransferase involved in cell wall biosynthesis
MIIGIDATNIRSGGGVIHLQKILSNSDPREFGFTKVIVWACTDTLGHLSPNSWLIKKTSKWFERNNIIRSFWQALFLDKAIKNEKCNILFIPGGSNWVSFKPVVTMNQNLLPFEKNESNRYNGIFSKIKWGSLRINQSRAFSKSDGVIFLSRYARKTVYKNTGQLKGETHIIPHGVDNRFFNKPKKQNPISYYDYNNPFRLIYVSSLEPYKHPSMVIKAIIYLRKIGYPVILEIIGSANKQELNKVTSTINKYDKYNCIYYEKFMPHKQLREKYFHADIAVYASTCETFGISLLEGMAAGLPTVCSNTSTMPEILGDAGVYFEASNCYSFTRVLKKLINSPELRFKNAKIGYEKAKEYSWEKCSLETFIFLKKIADNKKFRKRSAIRNEINV